MKSKDLSTLEHPELPLVRKPQRIKISDELLTRQKNLAGAIALCIQLSGLDDKEIYLTLEIDAGHWTRIKKGEAHFPVNKLDELMELCGNEVPLYWQLMHRGYDPHSLRKQETETERENRLLRERVAQLEHEREIELRLFRDLRVGV